jgi:hypothetical protein
MMVFSAQLAKGKGCTHSPFHSIDPIHSSYNAISTPLQKAVFRIPDPDPDSISTMQQNQKKLEISCFEVLDVLF